MSLNPSDSPKKVWNFFSPYTTKIKRQSYLGVSPSFSQYHPKQRNKMHITCKESGRLSEKHGTHSVVLL